jgi:hypothetical protein
MNSDLKVKKKRRGSIKITLELSPEQAEELSRAIKAGYFIEYDAIDATVRYPGKSKEKSSERLDNKQRTRGRRTAITIRLTVAERHTLTEWQRSTTIPAGRAGRGRIILLVADGVPISQIAATVGRSRSFVYKWIQRFIRYGIDGLSDQPGGSLALPRYSATDASVIRPA